MSLNNCGLVRPREVKDCATEICLGYACHVKQNLSTVGAYWSVSCATLAYLTTLTSMKDASIQNQRELKYVFVYVNLILSNKTKQLMTIKRI